jgi:hypothetical protein
MNVFSFFYSFAITHYVQIAVIAGAIMAYREHMRFCREHRNGKWRF